MPHFALVSVILLGLVSSLVAQTKPAQLPPGEKDAKAAVEKSPRHGEYVDVKVEGREKPVTSYVVYPEVKDKAPVVIVIHEIFGLSDWIKSVTDQLAADGFIAIAPDMLSGKGPKGGGTDDFAGGDVRKAVQSITPEDATKALDAVREYGMKLPASNGKTATIGFCWGGARSFEYATKQPGLSAAVVYYGASPSDDALKNVTAPVLGLYGSDDARVNKTIEPAQAAMKAAGKTYTPHIYEGAGHGFLRQQDGKEGANLKATQQAWPETVKFIREHAK
ncbi:MAG: dienelactone hydrolase family protein [Planctomycetota bacterium]|nr:dienelactone hydrolase family protein [Planctomycetota bacterium]